MMRFGSRSYLNLLTTVTFLWFKLREQRTALGLAWSFLNPLITTSVLFFLFKDRMGLAGEKSIVMYILVGIVVWNFFSISTYACAPLLLNRAALVRHAVFPKEVIIIAQASVFMIQHLSEIGIVLLFALVSHVGISWHLIALPLVMLPLFFLALGISFLLSCLNVYARDTEYIWNVLMRIGFFLVPIFYTPGEISFPARCVVYANPLTYLIAFYRDIILYHRFPGVVSFLLLLGISVVTAWGSYVVFKRHEHTLVENA